MMEIRCNVALGGQVAKYVTQSEQTSQVSLDEFCLRVYQNMIFRHDSPIGNHSNADGSKLIYASSRDDDKCQASTFAQRGVNTLFGETSLPLRKLVEESIVEMISKTAASSVKFMTDADQEAQTDQIFRSCHSQANVHLLDAVKMRMDDVVKERTRGVNRRVKKALFAEVNKLSMQNNQLMNYVYATQMAAAAATSSNNNNGTAPNPSLIPPPPQMFNGNSPPMGMVPQYNGNNFFGYNNQMMMPPYMQQQQQSSRKKKKHKHKKRHHSDSSDSGSSTSSSGNSSTSSSD